ncbi:hypothetical protein QFC20_004329 [Naganishia adeliensis]|uniref:Uncharacterized protein n=1 Tax=Naganishia adeliensis TaxID=92952 RepID=A0ACC2W1U6_9TREE|nr:hypothetical protein QFC20_004329 [Naganishia adeliensis]
MVFSIDFSGKNYIVTGGNRGIGLAITRAIAFAGGNVAILYRSSADAEQVADKLGHEFSGQKFKAYKCDVTDQARVQAVFQEVLHDFKGGMIHGVVANAGVAIVKDALEIGHEEFDYKTNVLGVFYTAQAAAKIWVDKGYKNGAIVVISSMSSQIYNQEGLNKPLKHVFYNSSKAAVSSMSKALAAEWAPYGIRVNIVSPGYVKTEQSGVHPEEVRKFQCDSVPLGRHSSYQTGSEVFIDGGYLIW